jgi:hypothetical protein
MHAPAARFGLDAVPVSMSRDMVVASCGKVVPATVRDDDRAGCRGDDHRRVALYTL